MKVLAAYLLAKLSGNENPSPANVKKILESVGAEIDDGRIELLFSLIKDHDVIDLIASGREKMAALSSSGGGGIAVAAGTGDGAAAPAAAAAAGEEKKEEKKKEEEEEEDDDIMMNLFD